MRFRAVAVRAGALAAAALIAWAPGAPAQDAFRKGLDAYLGGNYAEALEHWGPAAESGDAVAAFNIGVLHAQGLGVDPDPGEAVKWYRQSAMAGYANAQFNLGAAYYNGEGAEVNVAQAVSWWEKAAEQDHPEALYNLATLYRQGHGVEQDPQRALKLFERAAARGDARARQVLASMQPRESEAAGTEAAPEEEASGTAPAEPAQRDSSEKPLGQEDPAHWTVQIFAADGEQSAREFARKHGLSGPVRIYRAEVDGATWYKGIYGSYADKSAAKAARDELERKLPGSPPWVRSFRAIQAEAVGEVLPVASGSETPAPDTGGDATPEAGEGGEPGAPRAVTEVPETTDQDDSERAPAGEAEESDSVEQAKAEEPGDDVGGQQSREDQQAALRRGQRAFNDQSYTKAMEIWRPLAEQGVPEAQYGVGFMYESGWGVDRSYDEAFRWYQLAAQQGHVKSQYNLGMLYRNGQGVSRNDALGLYWIQTAADRGDERAATYLKNLN